MKSGHATNSVLQGGNKKTNKENYNKENQKELNMVKNLLVSVAILTLSTSAALAAHRSHHHRHATPAVAADPAAAAAPVMWTGGVSSEDREMRVKNLRDSGYNPKDDFNSNGTVKVQ
jgi:hypothetical protein